MLTFKKSTVEQLLITGFSLTFAVLLLVGGIAWNIAVPMGAFQSVDHSREVMATLEKLHGLVGKGILSQQEFDAKKAELLKKLA